VRQFEQNCWDTDSRKKVETVLICTSFSHFAEKSSKKGSESGEYSIANGSI
jgi:hypothetical protein